LGISKLGTASITITTVGNLGAAQNFQLFSYQGPIVWTTSRTYATLINATLPYFIDVHGNILKKECQREEDSRILLLPLLFQLTGNLDALLSKFL
jgi:hypothetical protein